MVGMSLPRALDRCFQQIGFPQLPKTRSGRLTRLLASTGERLAQRSRDSAPARTLSELQAQLDALAHYYNAIRPHRALGGRTPLQAYSARLKARPAGASPDTHFRVRSDGVDETGKIRLRF